MDQSKVNKYLWNKEDVEWLILDGMEVTAKNDEEEIPQETNELIEKVIDNLTDAISKNTMDIDTAAYRLCLFPGIKNNDIFIDKNFVSTTLIRSRLVSILSFLEQNNSSLIPDITIAVINVPKGTNALIPSSITGEMKEEGELILEKNTVFCVTGLGEKVKVNDREYPVIQLIPGYETQEDIYKYFKDDPQVTIEKLKAFEKDN